jgi:hypothetical protein
MDNARTIPPFSKWQTYGGGTSSPARHSYHVPVSGGPVSVHGSPGMYMVDPVFSATGRYLGYRVLFCDAGGELISRGAQLSLYRDVTAKLVTLPEARRAVREDFERHFTAPNPAQYLAEYSSLALAQEAFSSDLTAGDTTDATVEAQIQWTKENRRSPRLFAWDRSYA